jgi:ribonuclease P/MRP protein subunit POP5
MDNGRSKGGRMKFNKLKILPPTLREKKRYILFQVISEEPIVYEDLEQAIWNQFLDTFGELGVSRLDMRIIRNLYRPENQTCVISCNHASVQQVIAGLGLLSRLGDSRIIIKILKVSGTIKGLRGVGNWK